MRPPSKLDAWALYGPLLPNQYLRVNWWTFVRLSGQLVRSDGRA